jgi:hypothetical protein
MADNNIHGDLICTKDGYKTCDLYLAAFFATSGCPIKNTTRDIKKVYFFFENSEIIERLKAAYFLRQGKVDALSYADNVKSLKSLCASIIGNEIKRI